MKHTIALLFLCCCYGLQAQKASQGYSLQELKAQFKHKNYSEKVLLDFQKTMEGLRQKPELNEDIPGEVISWYTLNGTFSWYKTYLVKQNKIVEVATLPKDEAFLKKLNSFVPEKSRFTYSSDLWSFAVVKKRLPDGAYLINATARSFNSYPDIPNDDILMYNLEYKTKDFKTFTLVRLKDSHTEKWTEVSN